MTVLSSTNDKSHIPALAELRINGVTPFHSHPDGVDERLAEAYAILTLLAGAHGVCEEVSEAQADAFDNIRHEIVGRALTGVSTLIALAQYHSDCARAERRK